MLSIHKFIPQTLLARFVLIIIVPTLIGQILAVFLFYDRHWYNVSYYTSNIIANEIISLLEKDDNNLLEKNTIATNYLNLSYQFYPKLTLPPTQPRISEELEIFKNIINVKINKNNIVKLNDTGQIEVLFQLTDGLIKITFPAKLLMNPTAYIFVLWLIFLTILLLSVSLIFSKNQIKSILILADAAEQFGQGITKLQTFKPSGAKEIKKAGIAFLKMKERIEKQISKRTRMLAMISHDLCTPLTRMKLQLELMNKSEETEGLREDIVAMQQMIKSYLDFARGENGEEAQIIELSSWISNIINKWSANIRPLAKFSYAEEFEGDASPRTAAYSNVREDSSTASLSKLPAEVEFCKRSIELIVTEQPVYTQIKPTNFERAISNVINNAIKYSTKIKITICSSSTNVIIKIEDNGIGIKDEEKLLVFKAFYRSDKSRSLNNSGNVGLGLAITKEIIIDHNGTISLQDSKTLGGLLVAISLPIIQK